MDHILSLNRADIEVQSGNFSSWMTNFTYRQACELAQNEQLKKEIGRLKQASAVLPAGPTESKPPKSEAAAQTGDL